MMTALSMDWMMIDVDLLKRVIQFVFGQDIVAAYHNCATSGEISVEGKKKIIS